jgi:uncharacterized protein
MSTGRTIAHIEIPAKDREETAKFYHDLFGWSFQHMGAPVPYTMFKAGNVDGGYPDIDGQMFQGNDLIIYVSSDDLDADLKRAQDLGGSKVMGVTEVPGFGTFAIFNDPSGNRIALWKSAQPGS